MFLISLLFVSGCDTSTTMSQEADRVAIENMTEAANRAYLERDWDKFSSFFTEDGVWLPPGQPPLTGRDRWWGFVERFWNVTAPTDLDLVHDEIVVEGDWAFERHRERQTYPGNRVLYYKAIRILQRQHDGSWKISRYIWNADELPEQ